MWNYYVCGFHNACEIREVLAIFSRDLMQDKLRAVGVSGRDLADDDDEYTLLSPEGWATGPCRPLGGRHALLFFSPGTSLQI